MARRFDLNTEALGENAVAFEEFVTWFGPYTEARGVKGIQMLINTWLKHLLTPEGTDYTDVSYGTPFMNLAGSTTPIADAQDIVVLAISKTNEYLFRLQDEDTTLTVSERLASATLVSYTEDPSGPGFRAVVEFRNEANEIAKLPLPNPST